VAWQEIIRKKMSGSGMECRHEATLLRGFGDSVAGK
jgi:hypothetical protein